MNSRANKPRAYDLPVPLKFPTIINNTRTGDKNVAQNSEAILISFCSLVLPGLVDPGSSWQSSLLSFAGFHCVISDRLLTYIMCHQLQTI